MIRAVGQRHRHVHHGEAERPVLEVVRDADLDRRDVILRHHAAGDGVGELEPGAARLRLDVQHHVAELSVSARLLLVPAADRRPGPDRLLVGNVAPLPLDRDAILALQPFECDPQMHLALARQHDLMGVGVMVELQRRVLLDQLVQRRRQLHLVLAVLEAEPDAIHRLRRLRDSSPARCRPSRR